MTDQQALIAHHEAGHAVACYFLGLRVTFSTSHPKQEQTAIAHITVTPPDYSQRRLCALRADFDRWMIAVLAGDAAERVLQTMCLGKVAPSQPSAWAVEDWELAENCAVYLAREYADISFYLAEASQRATEIVADTYLWPAVMALADSLSEGKPTTYEQATEFIKRIAGQATLACDWEPARSSLA